MKAQPSRAKRPTSSDVARLAGVSRTTVSLVLNNVPMANISEETRLRVHQAVAELDYHPHEAARNLRTQASHILGVAIPDLNNPHYLQIVAGIDGYAKSKGYSIFLSITNFSVEGERRCFEQLKQKRNDALILISGTGRALLGEIRAMNNQGYHITNLSFPASNMGDANIDTIVPVADVGERLLLEHLLALGHRRIGYIYGVADRAFLSDRLNTCLRIQRELGVPVVDAWVRLCGPTPAEGFGATRALLHDCQGQERPTALVVVNDLLATGVLAALDAEQMRVPEEMSVASFDNAPIAAYTVPPLTSVDYDAYAMGADAARLTIERLAHQERPATCIERSARLVVRRSTGPLMLIDK